MCQALEVSASGDCAWHGRSLSRRHQGDRLLTVKFRAAIDLAESRFIPLHRASLFHPIPPSYSPTWPKC